MADNTTELEVLNQIVDVLGGQSGQYETVVPVLQQIKELLAAGITDPEAIAEAVAAWLDEHPEATTTVQDGSITGVKIADDTIPDAKLAQTGGVLDEVADIKQSLTDIKPRQIDMSAQILLLDIDGVTSESGYYQKTAEGSAPTHYTNLQHYNVPVEAGDVLRCRLSNSTITEGNYRTYFCTVDANGLSTALVSVTPMDNYVYQIVIPANAVMAYLTYGLNTDTWVKKVQNTKYYHEWLGTPSDYYKYGDFSGKTITAFGDSITYGVCSPNLGNAGANSYIRLFASKVGATLVNDAVSGSCITDEVGITNSIYDKVTEFTGQTDFIFVAGGVNDYYTGKTLGSFGDSSSSTFYGALDSMCSYLASNYQAATVVFITPVNTTREAPNAVASLNDYRNAIYEIATKYKFNVVDGGSIDLPMVSGSWGNLMIDGSDGVHPTLLGHFHYYAGLCGKLL